MRALVRSLALLNDNFLYLSLKLNDNFLLAVEQAQQCFETNPLFWLLHESIYCNGEQSEKDAARGPSRW